MDHLVILNKSWQLLPKIIAGEKTVESRWYQTKRVPWNRIQIDDTLYLKNSGERVTATARVSKVLQFANLNDKKIGQIIQQYRKPLGINSWSSFQLRPFLGKRYCILVFITNVQTIKPFFINKTGYGAQTAWITVNNIKQLRY